MQYRLQNATVVKLPGFDAFLYNTKQDFSPCSMVFVDCHESHDRVFVLESHRIYFVVEGSGIFRVAGEQYLVGIHDVIVIEPQQEYEYRGKMKLFELNFPATDGGDEIKVNRE